MNSRHTIGILAVMLGLVLFVPGAHGQGRGMRGSSSDMRFSSSPRVNRVDHGDHQSGRRFENGFGFPFAPFYDPGYYFGTDADYGDAASDARPAEARILPPQPAAPPPPPGDTLILENHDGQWVRIPTGAEMVKTETSTKVQNLSSTDSQAAKIEMPAAETPSPALPPALLVFRDGHTEEIQKYVIHGADLYATLDYSTSGSWTKQIPLADLDIPASLKANKDRGAKFNLPSSPNEVVVRF